MKRNFKGPSYTLGHARYRQKEDTGAPESGLASVGAAGAEIVDTRPLLLALAESEGVKLKDLYTSDGHLDRLANKKVAQATAAILINEWTGSESSPE